MDERTEYGVIRAYRRKDAVRVLQQGKAGVAYGCLIDTGYAVGTVPG